MTKSQATIEANKLIAAHPMWSQLTGKPLIDKRYHLKLELLGKRRNRDKYISQWRCIDCGRPRHKTYLRCFNCLKKSNDIIKKRRDALISQKRCRDCANVINTESGTSIRCGICRVKQARYDIKRR